MTMLVAAGFAVAGGSVRPRLHQHRRRRELGRQHLPAGNGLLAPMSGNLTLPRACSLASSATPDP